MQYWSYYVYYYWQHCTSAPVFIYSEAYFEVFRPAGATCWTDGGEIWHGGGPPPCQISPPSVQLLGYRTPKLKFLLRFDQNVEYKRHVGAYLLSDFHKICRVCTQFQDALAVKISLDLLKGLRSYGVLSWWGLVIPKFSAPPSIETIRQTPKSFRGARTCSRSSITMPSLVGLGFHPPPGGQKRFFVCLSVRHAFERQRLCARFRHEGVGVQKRFWYCWIEGL